MNFPRCTLVGAHFRGADIKALVQTFHPGSPSSADLSLRREPDNQFDPNAIQVLFENLHVGYIEASVAAWMAGHLDDGMEVHSVEIVSIEQDARGNNKPILSVDLAPRHE